MTHITVYPTRLGYGESVPFSIPGADTVVHAYAAVKEKAGRLYLGSLFQDFWTLFSAEI